MKKALLSLSLALALAVPLASAADGRPELGSFGIELGNRDTSVRPGDDFNRHANGAWYDAFQLRDYQTRFGSFNELSDRAEAQVRTIIEELQQRQDLAAGSNEQKIRDFFASYMDLAARDAAGITPLAPVLSRIAAIEDHADLVAAFGRSNRDGSASPISVGIGLDRKDPNRYLVGIGVGGLGLPDRDFYFNPAPRFVQIREAYVAHIATMLGFAGKDNLQARAEAVMALETAMAQHHWERAALRDRERTYNLKTLSTLKEALPGHDWVAHFEAQGFAVPAEVNVTTPSAVEPVIGVIRDTPIAVWRDYLAFHTIDNHAPFLSSEIDAAGFAFNGTVLNGQPSQRELWKRGVALVGGMGGLGDAVGQIYVERHFPPAAKAAMDRLVENLRTALRQHIDQLDWMSPATKVEAHKKLESFRAKIGYPSQWRDYSSVTIVPDDLMANLLALREFNVQDRNRRLGSVPDREEWFMTPHTVNAYYNAVFNEIVFPAAILQPPFFDVNADPAVNYGAIGGVIGHEMGHGFDDQGSRSDWQGIQRNWWTDEDRARFEARTAALVAQYNRFCPLEGHCVNGQLSLGENIADLAGLSMAWTAYQISLDGQEAPVIDGVTGAQRFFLAWAQIWRSKHREEALINQLRVGPHSPPEFRINGVVRNIDAWYEAFNVQPGDDLYLPENERVRIW